MNELERLTDCWACLRMVICQAGSDFWILQRKHNRLNLGDFKGLSPEDAKMPEDLESCERKLIEIVKQHTRDWEYEDKSTGVPEYFAGWLGAYEGAFEYLVEHGLARWTYEEDHQSIVFTEDLDNVRA